MHRIFREALQEATGESQFVIAVMIDIRGFSAFSEKLESPDTAMYVKRVYMSLIDEYFPYASFYKSTGDGLLLLISFDEHSLIEVSQKVMDSCVRCHADFGGICDNDPMINFETPSEIGIGVSRGTACCLRTGDQIIDYSGRLINLTARLTDLARPSGIVIDTKFKTDDVLTEEQKQGFIEGEVFIKGIAEEEPIAVSYTGDFTEFPNYNLNPMTEQQWQYQHDTKKFRDIEKLNPFVYRLKSEPQVGSLKIEISHKEMAKGEAGKKYDQLFEFDKFKYFSEGNKPNVQIDFPKLTERLKANKVTKDMDVQIEIRYAKKV
jgi:class 3 adenylate cyclase